MGIVVLVGGSLSKYSTSGTTRTAATAIVLGPQFALPVDSETTTRESKSRQRKGQRSKTHRPTSNSATRRGPKSRPVAGLHYISLFVCPDVLDGTQRLRPGPGHEHARREHMHKRSCCQRRSRGPQHDVLLERYIRQEGGYLPTKVLPVQVEHVNRGRREINLSMFRTIHDLQREAFSGNVRVDDDDEAVGRCRGAAPSSQGIKGDEYQEEEHGVCADDEWAWPRRRRRRSTDETSAVRA